MGAEYGIFAREGFSCAMTNALPAQPPPAPTTSRGPETPPTRSGIAGKDAPANFDGLLNERTRTSGKRPESATAVEVAAPEEVDGDRGVSESESPRRARDEVAAFCVFQVPSESSTASPVSFASEEGEEESVADLPQGVTGEATEKRARANATGTVDAEPSGAGALKGSTPESAPGQSASTPTEAKSAFAHVLAAKGSADSQARVDAATKAAAAPETSETPEGEALVSQVETPAPTVPVARLRHRAAAVYGERRATAAMGATEAENSTEEVRFRFVEGAEKASAKTPKDFQEIKRNQITNLEVLEIENLKSLTKKAGIGVATKDREMFTLDSNLPFETSALASHGAAAPLHGNAAPAASSEVGRPALLPSEIVKLHEQVARVAESGGGRFELQWGNDSSERVTVNVTLREGQWQVEFRSANPELTRFLQREWSQTAEFRANLQGRPEAMVRFTADDSRQDQPERQASRDQLSDDETTFLAGLRRRRASSGNA